MNNYDYIEEGEICDVTPFSNCQTQGPSHDSTVTSSDSYGSNTINTSHNIRDFSKSEYYYNSDDDSIKSSRPCTPPGLTSAVVVPQAPEPVLRTMSSIPGLIMTNHKSPTPQQSTNSPRVSGIYSRPKFASSSENRGGKSGNENTEPLVCPVEPWEIPLEVYEKVQSALARVLAMDKARTGAGGDCQHSHGTGDDSLPAEKCSVQDQQEEYECHHDHKMPKSPLCPEELERAIRIVEELSVVDKVPPDVFVQSGISAGTLYHAFKHLGHTLERRRSIPKSPAYPLCRK